MSKTKIFIEKAKKIHGDTFGYDKTAYTTAKIKVIIMCHTHGSFAQTPNSHLNGAGCMKCYREKRRTVDPTATTKMCTICNTIKCITEFYHDSKTRDGRHNECTICMSSRRTKNKKKYADSSVIWRHNNIDRVRAYAREYYKNNHRQCLGYITPEKTAERGRNWRRKIQENVCFIGCDAIPNKKQATPPWSETPLILKLYEECSTVTNLTGVEHNVDHIIPLNGKNVCGLHCIDNLQIITKTENIKKSNKHHSYSV